MPNSLDELRKEAEAATKARGHTIKWVPPWHGERVSIQGGYCTTCMAEVQLLTHPKPNEIGIGGEAVAVNCS